MGSSPFLFGEKMKIEWPIWECISLNSLVEMAQYQWLNYGTKLDIFPRVQDYTEQFFVESLVEIDRLMRQPPSRSRPQKRVI